MRKGTWVLAAIFLVGCNPFNAFKLKTEAKSASEIEKSTSVPASSDDLEFAKLILKKDRKPVNIKKDPFAPLRKASEKKPTAKNSAPAEENAVEGIEFLGVGGMDKNVGALLSSPQKKGLVFVNETFQGLTVVSINENEVTLKKGDQVFTIKRRDR